MAHTRRGYGLMILALLAGWLLGACAPATPIRITDVPTTPVLVPAQQAATQTAAAPVLAPTAAPPTSVAPTAAPATAAPATEPALKIESLADLRALVREIRALPAEAAQARADAVYGELAGSGRVPLILGDQVIFFYKGAAGRVEWRGAWNSWNAPGVEGAPISQTDLWTGQLALPLASRVEYKIVLNDSDWLVDPANPNTQLSGLTGDNNVITMPGFTASDESAPRAGVTPGALSGDLALFSHALGYTVNYRVYTPAGYEQMDHLPVLYVLDGNDFTDARMGAMPTVLDNLIADGRIAPALAVFADAREPGNPSNNRRESEFIIHGPAHARFIADELVPAVDGAYRTDPRPEARVIVGVSYGGLSALYIGASQSAVFHNVAAFSPSLWAIFNPDYLPTPEHQAGARLMKPAFDAISACGGQTGIQCPALPLNLFVSAGVPAWDVGNFSATVAVLREQGYPIQFDPVLEGHTWSHWRGQTDEMLEYFLGGAAGAQ